MGLSSDSIFLIFVLALFVVGAFKARKKKEAATRQQAQERSRYDSQIVCAQCQQKGSVTTRRIKTKTGISGAKATGAVLTGGLSILATGLSRKEDLTEARCDNCGSVWRF